MHTSIEQIRKGGRSVKWTISLFVFASQAQYPILGTSSIGSAFPSAGSHISHSPLQRYHAHIAERKHAPSGRRASGVTKSGAWAGTRREQRLPFLTSKKSSAIIVVFSPHRQIRSVYLVCKSYGEHHLFPVFPMPGFPVFPRLVTRAEQLPQPVKRRCTLKGDYCLVTNVVAYQAWWSDVYTKHVAV